MKIEDLTKVSIPFSLYDFFGYLLPGFTFGILLVNSGDLVLMYGKLVANYGGQAVTHDYKPIMPEVLVMMKYSPFIGILITVIGAYIAGHILSSLSSLLFERFFVEKLLKFPASNLFTLTRTKAPIWRQLCFPKYRKPYNEDFRKAFLTIFEIRFNLKEPQPHEIFWLSFEEISLKAPAAFARSTHFLNLYGFSRTMSMAFLLAGLGLTIGAFRNDFLVPCFLVLCYFGLSFLMFWNYLKLLRRLNDEVFRAFYTISTCSNKE